MTRNTHKKRIQTEPSPRKAIMSASVGVAAAAICSVAIILISGMIIAFFCPDPGAAARIAGYALLYISSAVGGFFAYRRCRGYMLLCGLYTGLGFTVLTLLLSLFIPSAYSGMNGGLALILRLPIILTSIGGAFLGAYRPQKRHKHKRKR